MTTSKKKSEPPDPKCLSKPTAYLQCTSKAPVRLRGRGVFIEGDLVVVHEDEVEQIVEEGKFVACDPPKTKPSKTTKQEDK